jgi:hypothetical protein
VSPSLSIVGGLIPFIAPADQQVIPDSGGFKSTIAATALATMLVGAIVVLIALALGGGGNGARLVMPSSAHVGVAEPFDRHEREAGSLRVRVAASAR